MTEIKLSGPEVLPASGKKARQLMVFLHGFGANGNDLINIAAEFSHAFPDAHFISPNASSRCDMSSFGYQWFPLAERTPQKSAEPILNGFLDEQLARLGLEDKNLALLGFSQGTMMALYAGLRRKKPVAGIVGCSGAFIHDAGLGAEITAKPPVCLIHGTADQVVPFAAMLHAKEELEKLGVSVETHQRPGLGHGIDAEGISIGIEFFKKRLK